MHGLFGAMGGSLWGVKCPRLRGGGRSVSRRLADEHSIVQLKGDRGSYGRYPSGEVVPGYRSELGGGAFGWDRR